MLALTVFFFNLPLISGNGFDSIGMIIPFIPAIIIVNLFVGNGNFDMSTIALISTIVLGIIIWFLVGVIIGWFYGKIKNRKGGQS